MSRYNDFLKKNEPMDNYILFLLACEWPVKTVDSKFGRFERNEDKSIKTRRLTIAEVATLCDVSSPTVLGTMRRHRGLVQNYFNDRLGEI